MIDRTYKWAHGQWPKEFGDFSEKRFRSAPLRILFVYPSPLTKRIVSATHQVLDAIVSNHNPEVFVDHCFLIDGNFGSKYYANNSVLQGSKSGMSYKEFDVVGISCSIPYEETLQVFRWFKQIDIPFHSKERIFDKTSPLIVHGGVSASMISCLENLMDLYVLGLGERTIQKLVDTCIRFGNVKANKSNIVQDLQTITGFYNPKAYHYDFKVEDGVIHGYFKGSDAKNKDGTNYVPKCDTSLPMDFVAEAHDTTVWFPLADVSRAKTTMSLGCGSCGSCNFCEESHVYGVWREVEFEKLKQNCHRVKKDGMADCCQFYSFNSNQHGNFQGALAHLYKEFGRIAVVNFRMNGLASSIKRNPDYNYLNLLYDLGVRTVVSSIEGVSDRIRNNLLNKSLNNEDILLVCKHAFDYKFTRHKTNFIYTGYEEESDWDELERLYRDICGYHDSTGSDCAIHHIYTHLMQSRNTPISMLPRMSALKEYVGWKNDKAYYSPWNRIRELGVRIQFCTLPREAFLQQLSLDLPADYAEKLFLVPALTGMPSTSNEMAHYVDDTAKSLGIDLAKQFKDYDHKRSGFQHLRTSVTKNVWWDKKDSFFLENHHPCVKIEESAYYEEGVPKCYGCPSCSEVDTNAKELGMFTESQLKWAKTRTLHEDITPKEILETKIAMTPTKRYMLVFNVNSNGQHVGKDQFFRMLLVHVGKKDTDFVNNFRERISANYYYTDQPCQASMSTGIQCVVFETLHEVDIGRYKSYFEDFIIQGGAIDKIIFFDEVPRISETFWSGTKLIFKCSRQQAVEFTDTLKKGKMKKFDDDYSSQGFSVETFPARYYYDAVFKDGTLTITMFAPFTVYPIGVLAVDFSYSRIIEFLEEYRVIACFREQYSGFLQEVTSGKSFPLHKLNYSGVETSDSIYEDHALEQQGA